MRHEALAFITELPLSTPLNALMLTWLQSQSATSENLPDAWLEFLGPGNRNDLWFAYLGGLGYTGALPDREHAFWTDQRLGQFRAPLETSLVAKGLEAATATFARNSTALDPDDKSSVAIDVARFSADGWFGEPQRENLFKQSRGLATTPWSQVGTMTVVADQVGIDGVANTAFTVADVDAGVTAFLAQGITISDDSADYAVTFYIVKDTDETRFPHVQLLISGGGTTMREAFTFNTATGDVLRIASDQGSETVEEENGFWKITVFLANNSSGNTSLALRLYPALNTVFSLTGVASTTGSIGVDAVQVEKASFPTTHIITTTAAATREADDLLYADAWDWTNDIAGSIDWTPSADDQAEVWFLGNYTDANNAVGVLHDGTNAIVRKRIAGVDNDATKALNYVVGTTYNIKWRFSSTEGVDIWVEEVKGTNDPTTTDATVDADLSVGNDGNGAGYQSGSIKNLRIVEGNLTDAQVVAF